MDFICVTKMYISLCELIGSTRAYAYAEIMQEELFHGITSLAYMVAFFMQAFICKGDVFMARDQLDAAEMAYSAALKIDPSLRRSKSFKVRKVTCYLHYCVLCVPLSELVHFLFLAIYCGHRQYDGHLSPTGSYCKSRGAICTHTCSILSPMRRNTH